MIPQWISKLFQQNSKEKPQYKVASEGTLHAPIHRTSTIIDQTAKVVCKECNEGWMDELEKAARPLLTPLILDNPSGNYELDLYAQATILTWAIKTAMVFDRTTRRTARKFYKQAERVEFANSPSFLPPSNVHVWIARYGGKNAQSSTIQNLSLRTEDGLRFDHVQAITVTIRHFAFQVVAGRWSDRLDLDEIDNSRLASGRTLRLWPTHHPLFVWPALRALSDETLKPFADRFDGQLPMRRTLLGPR